MYNYYYLFYSFILYSLLGWIIEVVYHLYKEKKFVNRGFLFGPLCPIYGSTAVLLIILVKLFGDSVYTIFLGGVILASLMELVTGYVLEVLFNTKWWDYSEERLNFMGYICLKFSLIWGVLALVFVKLINPNISRLTYLIMNNFGEVLYNIILILLVADIVHTINSMIEFKKLFVELQGVLLETKNNMDELMERTLKGERKNHIKQRISYLGELKDRLSDRVSLRHKSMLRAYPHITSKRFGTAIEEIKKKLEKINKHNS